MDIYFDYNCVIHFVNLPNKVIITQTKKRALKIDFCINATSIIKINLVFNNNSIIGIIHNNCYLVI